MQTVEEPHVTFTVSKYSVKCPSPSKSVWTSPLKTDTADGDRASVVVKLSWCEDGRHDVEADLLAKCKDRFGTPRHHYSFCPTDSHGKPISTGRFLPTDKEKPEDFHWAIASDYQVPSHPQRRSLWIHVSKLVGQLLVHAKTPWDLFIALGHGMLGACWLGYRRYSVSCVNRVVADAENRVLAQRH